MPGTGAFAFTDPGDYKASLDEARVELVVTGAASFKASLTRAELAVFVHAGQGRQLHDRLYR